MYGKMNDTQKQWVEEHMDVIDRVIWKCIRINNQVYGMEYDDIYQVGAIGLCKAAMNYRQMSTATFSTYAFQVIRNTILDYLRSLNAKQEAFQRFISEVDDYKDLRSDEIENDLYEKEVFRVLEETKERYKGTARKGIEAIEMKMQGYSGKDIAEKYNVNANYITACISRAQKHLQKDDVFLNRIA